MSKQTNKVMITAMVDPETLEIIDGLQDYFASQPKGKRPSRSQLIREAILEYASQIVQEDEEL